MSTTVDAPADLHSDDVAAIDELGEIWQRLRSELGKVIVGQDEVVEQLAICLFARGHALLMGVPGLAKTLLVSRLAEAMNSTSGARARKARRRQHPSRCARPR